MGWNYLFIPKLQRCNRWRNVYVISSHTSLACDYLSMLGLKLALVQIMACRLFGAKPSSKPILGYWLRGVARRRPRDPGLNLKLQKKKKWISPKIQIHVYMKYNSHIKHLSLLLAAIKSPDTTYIIFYIFVSTHSYMIFCQQLTEWSFITIISDVSTILWLITLELWSIFWKS